jgi:hypothetical protein
MCAEILNCRLVPDPAEAAKQDPLAGWQLWGGPAARFDGCNTVLIDKSTCKG